MKGCWLPFYHAEIYSDGTVKPCCKFQSPWLTSIDQYTLKDRSEFDTEKLPNGCWPCKVSEQSYSYRKHRTIEFKKRNWVEPEKPVLKSLNITLDNICSSSCLQCDPTHSTTIGTLLKNPQKRSWNLDALDPYLDTIEYLTISGGEPLQSPRLLEVCEKLKRSSIKAISIPSGLANIKLRNIEALLDLGVLVQCRVSIDAPWGPNEWIRGCDKDDWLRNFDLVKNSFALAWQITIGSYNIFALPECLDYIETLSINKHIQPSPVLYPPTHAVRQMPFDLKKAVAHKLSNYVPKANAVEIIKTSLELLQSEPTLDWNSCIEKIELIPKLRNDNRTLESFIKHYL
jgi:hypothetical protein